jgi:subtilisin family serine protease
MSLRPTASLARLAALGVCAATLSAGSVLAGNLFGKLPSTADGYATWDSDLINVEGVTETGHGVYVAVLDTGLVPHWRDYFPVSRVATDLGKGFVQPVTFKARNADPCGLEISVGRMREATWVGSTGSTHGTHVASTILGYAYRSNFDAASGFPLPPIMVRGIAPDVTVIPVRVLADYQLPALPACGAGVPAQTIVFGTSEMVAAGIDYVTDLAIAGYRPMVINMSLGGGALEPVEKAALDRAIANGVIVVASAGNSGEFGMGYPGGYPPVISVGSAGWTGEWHEPADSSTRYRMWWLQYPDAPLLPGSGDTADPTSVDDVYVSDFSSREWPGQELDVLAPGSWVRGPFPGDPGFNHLPWWSKGIADLVGGNGGNFYYVGGTSMASPHVASLAALILQKNPALTQAEVESILKTTALPIPAAGSRSIFDLSAPGVVSWDTDCFGIPCNAVGAGLVQADAALGATP